MGGSIVTNVFVDHRAKNAEAYFLNIDIQSSTTRLVNFIKWPLRYITNRIPTF